MPHLFFLYAAQKKGIEAVPCQLLLHLDKLMDENKRNSRIFLLVNKEN
jgi:hypothetical protein